MSVSDRCLRSASRAAARDVWRQPGPKSDSADGQWQQSCRRAVATELPTGSS